MAKRKKALKPIPTFKSEAEERAFWAKAEPLDYFDADTARRVNFPNLKPTEPMKAISMRLPELLIADLKTVANAKAIPYQTLAKMYLAEAVNRELGRRGSGKRKAR